LGRVLVDRSEKAILKIHIGPSKTKNLTLPQAKRKRDRPPNGPLGVEHREV
jgi:hypothetical protein